MPKSIDAELKKTAGSDPAKLTRSPSTTISAILEAELRCCDVFCISKDEKDEVIRFNWRLKRHDAVANIAGIPATNTLIPGRQSVIRQLFGIGSSGSRCAFVARTDPRDRNSLRSPAPAPFVLHSLSEIESFGLSGHGFSLTATNPQQAADFSIIAHRIAELAVCPGRVISIQDPRFLDYTMIHEMSMEHLESYLGLPADIIETPTASQRAFFGETRRRIPVHSGPAAPGIPAELMNAFQDDLPQLVLQAMDEFNNLTGKSYGVIDGSDLTESDIVIISPAQNYVRLENQLQQIISDSDCKVGIMRPVLNHPFPAHEIVKLIKGKTCVALENPAKIDDNNSLLQRIQLGIDKAMTNGVHRYKDKKAIPFDDYPVFSNTGDWPLIYRCDPSGFSDPENLIEMINTIKKTSPDSIDIAISRPKRTVKGKTAGMNRGVHLIYVSTDCYASGALLSNALLKYFGLHIRQFGNPQDDLTHLFLSPIPNLDRKPQSSAELMFCPDVRSPGVRKGLTQIQDGGAVVFRGDPKNPMEVWHALSEECRSIISDRNISFFILASESTTEDDDGARDWSVPTLLGGFVEIATRRQFAGTSKKSRQYAFDSMSSNGDLNALLALKKAMSEIKELDYSSPESVPFDGRDEDKTLRMPSASNSEEEQEKRDDILKELLEFYLNRGYTAKPGHRFDLIPVHYHQFRQFATIRYEYPVCIAGAGSDSPVIPLVKVIDGIIEHLAAQSDDDEQIKHELLRVETAIRTILESKSSGQLSELWDEAVEIALSESHRADEKKKMLAEKLSLAKSSLENGANVLNCGKNSTIGIFDSLSLHRFSQKASDFLLKLDEMIVRLSDLLRLDSEQSPHGKQSDELRASIGTSFAEDLDINSFSEILKNAPHGEPLPEQRRNRVQKSLETIRALKPIFLPDRIVEDKISNASCDIELGRFYARAHSVAQLFLALRIAELELENKYNPDKHDALFAKFSLEDLREDELAVCPPFLLFVENDALDEGNKNVLLDILKTGYPIKILNIVTNVCSPDRTPFESISFSEWGIKAGRIAMALNNVFVLQTTASNLTHLTAGITDGLDYDGPAFFNVYCGSIEHNPRLNEYLVPAAALDSRAFPAFTYNPAAGENWAERFNLNDNTQLESDFPVSPIKYLLPDGSHDVTEVPFTLIEFLACDMRFNNYFRKIPDHFTHPVLVPFSEYLDLDSETRNEKIPFVMMINESGIISKVITTVEMISAALLVLSDWHNLRELGGVDNSYARVLLEKEKVAWEEDKAQEIKAIKEEHEQEFGKAIDKVANELISNIASGLLGLTSSQPGQSEISAVPLQETVTQPAADEPEPSKDDEAVKAEEPEVEDDEDELVSLDEPYIETPRCTTCNECTDINSLMFAYNVDKQAYIKDPSAGTYRQLVEAAEKCPVSIIHPGKPMNSDEPGLDELIKRAEPYL